jgi:4,5-DOPA dioxygenase extradiol
LSPSLFVSHGAPDLVLSDNPGRRFLSTLATLVPAPRAIVVASAHYTGSRVAVSSAAQPDTIHDFGGFPESLYRIRYPAAGDPDLAERIVSLLDRAGIDAAADPDRGLDHGVWIPLLLAWPDADVPLVSMSVDPSAGPHRQLAVGRAIAPLMEDGVLVIGSGGLTHNLRELDWRAGHRAEDAPQWARSFAQWMAERLDDGDEEALLDYRRLAPAAARNHPSEEHLLPLFTALGAVGRPWRAQRLHRSFTYGALAMDAFAFSRD